MKLTRRNSMRLSLGALACAAALPAAAASGTRRPAKACIVLFMHGGPSQIDTFDPKPGRDTGGPFAAIGTSVAGIQISEHLPRLAVRMHDLAVIRSLTSTEGNHDRARYLMHTGYAPAGNTPHPSLGALHSADLGGGALPGYVAINGPGHGAGLLGAAHGPFVVGKAQRQVRYLAPTRPVSDRRQRDRAALGEILHADFAQGRADPVVDGHAATLAKARTMMAAPELDAFDLTAESAKLRADYGDHDFGQGCLMARRLVEAGVGFVEVGLRGWDTHEDNFDRVRDLSAQLDQGMATLLDDLASRGLLEETLVVWTGDFGRTPRINARGGRDHYPRASSAVLAGGGLTTGQVIGATDRDGDEVTEAPVTVPDLMRTIATRLGLDPNKTRMTAGGRPLSLVDGGRVIAGLG